MTALKDLELTYGYHWYNSNAPKCRNCAYWVRWPGNDNGSDGTHGECENEYIRYDRYGRCSYPRPMVTDADMRKHNAKVCSKYLFSGVV